MRNTPDGSFLKRCVTNVKEAPKNEVQTLDLSEELKNLLEEARTIMPGVQALFGFQLIAVFNQSFSQKLTHPEQVWHLAATGLTAIAAGLGMSPAALHRMAAPDKVSTRLTTIATYLLSATLAPLALGVSIDFFLLTRIILQNDTLASVLGGGMLVVLVGLWYLLPGLLRGIVCQKPVERDAKGELHPVG